MSYQQEVFALIARLSGSRNKVMVERSLCEYMGSLEGGVFLSQLLYWSDKGNAGWFYKGHKEWHAETFLSEYQVRQCTKRCVELGFLETKLKKANGAPTVHYKLDGAKFMDSILKFFRIQSENLQNGNLKIEECILEKLQNPITETTTETTTEITAVAEAAPAAAAVDPDVAMVWEAWNDNMPGTKTKVIVDGVNDLLNDYSAAEIVEAITIACTRNKRNLGFVKGVLARGAFSEKPKPSGGDYAQQHRSTNRGLNAATDYMRRKGMIHE